MHMSLRFSFGVQEFPLLLNCNQPRKFPENAVPSLPQFSSCPDIFNRQHERMPILINFLLVGILSLYENPYKISTTQYKGYVEYELCKEKVNDTFMGLNILHVIMQRRLEIISFCSFSKSYANKCMPKATTCIIPDSWFSNEIENKSKGKGIKKCEQIIQRGLIVFIEAVTFRKKKSWNDFQAIWNCIGRIEIEDQRDYASLKKF